MTGQIVAIGSGGFWHAAATREGAAGDRVEPGSEPGLTARTLA